MPFINQKHLIFFLILNVVSIKYCICPDSYTISKYKITQGTWEPASNGNAVFVDRAVLGAIDPIDGERQYICRAENGRNMVPGKLVPTLKKCYIPRSGREHEYTSYEVLLNRDGYDLEWVNASYGQTVDGAMLGGFASGWPMYVCRGWHKGRQRKWRWVSGKLDPEPGYECCYISYGGYEYCKKSYQVLRNKL